MFNLKRFLTALIIMLPLTASCQTDIDDSSIMLGFANGRPAVYFNPQEGMKVQLKNIICNKSNRVIAYDLEFEYPTDRKLMISLQPGVESDQASADYQYKGKINGKEKESFPLDEWETVITDGLIAFFPERMGGYVIRYSGSITQSNVRNGFVYDETGNRAYGDQSFTHEGTRYEFKYSGHQRDDSGNLTGYLAEILTVKEESI